MRREGEDNRTVNSVKTDVRTEHASYASYVFYVSHVSDLCDGEMMCTQYE